MRIDSNHTAASLRLVRPPQADQPVAPTQPIRRPDQPADSYSFESLYTSKLPQPSLTDAHRRLERIREDLVAARTDVPIHFHQPRPSAPANPYAIHYQQAPTGPADSNTAATDQVAEASRPR